MKARVKAILIAGVLPLFVGAMIGMSMESSDAQMLKPTHPDVKRLSPKGYGSAHGKVCGDQLCKPGEGYRFVGPDKTPAMDVEFDTAPYLDKHDDSMPTVKIVDVRKYKPSTNKQSAVTFIVTYTVTSGNERLENIHVHVKSDMQEDTYNISSLDALKTSVNTIRIMALDADEISGGIVSYSIAPPTYDPRNPQLGQ
jgi:hypothetical protein